MPSNMKFKKRSQAFDLSATGIDRISEWLDECLVEGSAGKHDRIHMRLLFEEALLNMAEHYGEGKGGTAHLEKKYGRFRLRIVTGGERFNPLKPNAEERDEWSVSLFSVIDMHVQYSYSMGTNVLRMSLPRKTWNPVLKICIALVVGSLIGALGNIIIPDPAQEAFCSAVLTPISDMWVRLLQAISGPIIFLTALTATLGTKRLVDFGGSRLATLLRYFGISAVVVVFALLCCQPFFCQNYTALEVNGQVLSKTLDGILKIVPGNLVEPFSTANTPQLLLIAIVTGYLLAMIEAQVAELKVIIQQLNNLGLTVASFACSLVPFFVGLLLCLRIWSHDSKLLTGIWIPLVLSIAISAVALLAVILAASVRFHVSPLLLVRKLWGPFWKALKRGTIDFSSIDNLASFCERQLGIDGEFARASLPLGLFLYMPTSGVGICVFVLFAAQMQQLPVDIVWLVSAAAVSVILAVATPPVTGANLLSFVMAFQYLGINNDAFLDVMVFDLVFGVLCVAFDQAMLQIETIVQADRMGFLDEKVLHAPLAEES